MGDLTERRSTFISNERKMQAKKVAGALMLVGGVYVSVKAVLLGFVIVSNLLPLALVGAAVYGGVQWLKRK